MRAADGPYLAAIATYSAEFETVGLLYVFLLASQSALLVFIWQIAPVDVVFRERRELHVLEASRTPSLLCRRTHMLLRVNQAV